MPYRVIQCYTGSIARQQSCRMLAEALGFEVESVTTEPSFARAKRDLLDGRVKAGSVGGIRLVVSGLAHRSSGPKAAPAPVASPPLRVW